MSTRSSGRISAAKTGWVVVLLLLGWVVFLFAPFPSKEKPAARTWPRGGDTVQSKLESVGLENNPDWEGLPDYFAVWAGSIDWVENRTWFAYWNPGSYSYSYFIEATRDGREIRFRSLPTKPTDGRLELDDDDLSEYAKDRKGDSPTHPFVFAVKFPVLGPLPAQQWSPGGDPAGKSIEKVELKPGLQPIPPPPVKFPEQPNAEPKK